MLKITLKEYLEEKKIEIQWLADKTKIRYATVHDIVHRKRKRVSLEYLSRIMKALNISDPNILIKFEKEVDNKKDAA